MSAPLLPLSAPLLPLSAPLLQVRLRAGYRKQTILQDVTFDLYEGERLGLLGSSGAGKSTLLLAMMGLLSRRGGWAQGEVLLRGRDILTMPKSEARKLRGREFALVPQSPVSALNPALTLQAHFNAAWSAHRRPDKQMLRLRIADLAARVGLPLSPEFLDRKPGEISVGQAQRCVLALALLHGPSLLIADEPTSALDPVTQTEVLDLLRGISVTEQTAVLFVSHDLLSVFRLCSEIVLLKDGTMSQRVPLTEVSTSQDPELQRFLRALPVPADVLLRHMQNKAKHGTQVTQNDTLLLSSL